MAGVVYITDVQRQKMRSLSFCQFQPRQYLIYSHLIRGGWVE